MILQDYSLAEIEAHHSAKTGLLTAVWIGAEVILTGYALSTGIMLMAPMVTVRVAAVLVYLLLWRNHKKNTRAVEAKLAAQQVAAYTNNRSDKKPQLW